MAAVSGKVPEQQEKGEKEKRKKPLQTKKTVSGDALLSRLNRLVETKDSSLFRSHSVLTPSGFTSKFFPV
jgi:hypothetical protein